MLISPSLVRLKIDSLCREKHGAVRPRCRLRGIARSLSLHFVFGAGASYGAGGCLPSPPPLGPGLYPALQSSFAATWGSLPEKYASLYAAYYEDGMAAVWQEHSEWVPALMRDMAVFFARYRLDGHGNDCYSRLIKGLAANGRLDEADFATTNYECLFDEALTVAGRNVCYGPQPRVGWTTLWKLHGSCTFTVQGIKLQPGAAVYTSGATFHGNGIELIARTDVERYCATSGLYPCMSLYAPGKPNQMARAMIESMQLEWASRVAAEGIVVIIGLAPHPPDSHIWSRLASTPATLYYVGAEEPFAQWARANREGRKARWLAPTFEASLPDLLALE